MVKTIMNDEGVLIGSIEWCAESAWRCRWEHMSAAARSYYVRFIRAQGCCEWCGISDGERWGGRWGDPVSIVLAYGDRSFCDDDEQNLFALCTRHWHEHHNGAGLLLRQANGSVPRPDFDNLDLDKVDWESLDREVQSYYIRFVVCLARCSECGVGEGDSINKRHGGRVRLACGYIDSQGGWLPHNLQALCGTCQQKRRVKTPAGISCGIRGYELA